MSNSDQHLDEAAAALADCNLETPDGGGDVMDILAGVERQFERLRSVQAAHAEEVRSLAERAEALDRRGAELDQRRHELEAQREQMAGAARSLDEQRRELDERRAELEAQLAQLADERTQLDEHRDRIAEQHEQWGQAHEQRGHELDDREAALCEREEALGDHERRLAEADRRVAELEELLGRREQELTAAQADLEQARHALDQLREELDTTIRKAAQDEEAALELLQETERQRDEHARELSELGARRDDLAARLDEATAQIESLQRALDDEHQQLTDSCQREQQAQGRIEELTAGLAAREQELASLSEQVRALQHELEIANDKLQTAGAKLVEFSRLLSGQVPELERSAAVAAELEDQRRRIEQLTRQLAEAGDGEALARRDEQIQALTEQLEALHRERSDAGPAAPDAELLREREVLAERLAALEQQASDERAALTGALDAARADGDRLRQELEQRHQAAPVEAHEENSVLVERIADLEQAVEQGRLQLAAERDGAERLARQYQQLHAETTAELHRLRAEADAAPRDDTAETELAARSDALDRAAEHLRRRQMRLRRMRMRLSTMREQPAAPTINDQAMSIERRQLEEVRKLLVASEKLMLRKWARNRSVLTVCALLIILALNAAGAWMGATRLFPLQPAATITLVPEASAQLDASAQTEWARWHTALLHDEGVHDEVAGRMQERLLPAFASASAVRTMIVKELGVDAGAADGLALTLHRPDAEEARTALEVLVGTLLNESRRRAVDRGDTPSMVAPGLASAGREAISIQPVEDLRLAYAGPIFGGLCVVTLALFGAAYSQWSGSRRVLDEYAELFATSAATDPAEYEGTLKPLVWT
ncbi:MAG: coiled-coil domain-containing protein [Planctomycetota bacterium]|jgi:chromosome segregation ATPase